MKKILEQIKLFIVNKIKPFFLKYWMQLVNMIMLFVAYANLNDDSGASAFVGFWIFILLAYYIFWEWLGAKNIFKKKV